MQPDWQIRAAQAGDADGLQQCMQAAYAVYHERMQGEDLPPMRADYASEIRDYPCWVVDTPQGILGGLIMVFAEDKATIANVAVDPRFHGQGIGGALMRFAESVATARKSSRLTLATHRLLEENLSLYRHLGFAETGRDGNKIFLQKIISPPAAQIR